MVNFACTYYPPTPPTTPTNPPSPSLSALLLGKFTSVGKSRLVHNRSVFLDLFLFLRDCHQSRFSFNRNQPFSHRDAAFGPKKVVEILSVETFLVEFFETLYFSFLSRLAHLEATWRGYGAPTGKPRSPRSPLRAPWCPPPTWQQGQQCQLRGGKPPGCL